ncbi:MAG: helix-turn-helix transcriptional regulator [Streptosporangiaceae bacterium]
MTTMSRRKTERLLNLVICLLATRRHLTAERIREAVPGYPESDEAFKRMFERDKDELRELGVPIETGSDSVWDDEPGYRIRRADYELPEIVLEPDEAAVLGLAARVWQRASLGEAASTALLKLRAAGVDTADASLSGIEPRVGTSEAAFPGLWTAVRDRQPVTFDYRPAGSGEARRRRLEPWGVVSWHGHWYVAGHDLDRQAVRVFRVGRILGEVRRIGEPGSVAIPQGTDMRAIVVSSAEETGRRTAHLRVRKGGGEGLRHAASSRRPEGDGHDILEFSISDAERFADFVAGFGADAVVLDPPEARDALVRRLRGAADVEDGVEGAMP